VAINRENPRAVVPQLKSVLLKNACFTLWREILSAFDFHRLAIRHLDNDNDNDENNRSALIDVDKIIDR